MELFGTAGIRGDAAERVTPELAVAVGRAAGKNGREFVVGRDGRETGPALAAAVEAGLESAGASVVHVGKVPTPALAYAARGRHGLMITASHNPPADNGLKLFYDAVEYHRDAERRVEGRVRDNGIPAGPNPVQWDQWGVSESVEILPGYRDTVAEYAERIGAPLDEFRVAVDCGNGMASLATPQVLRALGADVVALNANVDGHFPGRDSKPKPESLTDLMAFLREQRPGGVQAPEFDLGVAHDGDADRVVFLDSNGEIIHEDTVLAILAERYTRMTTAGDPVVITTPNASARVDERVRTAGGRVERVRLGALHEGIRTLQEDGDDNTEVVFAGEPWKHIHPGLGHWIDGVASAVVFSRLVAAEGLETLRAPVTERPYRKVSIDCPDDRKQATMARVEHLLPEEFSEATVDTDHGVRLELPDGSWLLVRPSGTEPYVRLYAESRAVDALVERARTVIEAAIQG